MDEKVIQQTGAKQRYGMLDSIRGMVLLSMIIYHGVWNLVYIYRVDWDWYSGSIGFVWQQSICWSFIFLSGFCWSLGRKPWKRGMIVFGGGIMISAVTYLFMPENKIIFGILTLIGSCMVIMIPLKKLFCKIPAKWGVAGSLVLFILTRNINEGFLGFTAWNIAALPKAWYRGRIATYLGFTEADFVSADYFSLLPWLFLFVCGYFTYHAIKKKDIMERYFMKKIWPFHVLGKYSFFIYMIHQPILYSVMELLNNIW